MKHKVNKEKDHFQSVVLELTLETQVELDALCALFGCLSGRNTADYVQFTSVYETLRNAGANNHYDGSTITRSVVGNGIQLKVKQ